MPGTLLPRPQLNVVVSRYAIDNCSLPVPIESLIDMARGYAVCAVWSSTDIQDCSDNPEHLDTLGYSSESFTESALLNIASACNSFVCASVNDLSAALRIYTLSHRSSVGFWKQVGHDLWLTRNGHGAGFWDRGYGEVGDRLSETARLMGASDVYVTDNKELDFV